jgi:hypothetical protein
MKQTWKLLAIAAMMLVAMTSCNSDNEEPIGDDEVVRMLAQAEPIPLTEAQQQMRDNNNEFAWKLFCTARKTNGNQGNSFMSPLSVTYLLGMMDAGAAGSTRDEITATLGFGEDVMAVNEYCKTMIDGAAAVDPTATVRIANCVEVNSALGIRLRKQYVDDIKQYYHAQIDALDFTKSNSLDIINNHVRSRDENVKTISHDEVLAIKQAFVRALSQNGVGPDALNDIRRRIGLAPDPSLPVALAQRSMKPLSRQQIRSILDEHKETINNVAGNGTIRTHAEIYARHGNEALQRYEQTRRATNEEFMRGRSLDSDRRVLDIQRVIAGDIHFRNDADRRLLVSAAEMLRSEILRLSNGNPPDDPLGTIDYRRGNGLRITLGLGMSQKAFVDKLDDMLLQLRADRPTPQSALDALAGVDYVLRVRVI